MCVIYIIYPYREKSQSNGLICRPSAQVTDQFMNALSLTSLHYSWSLHSDPLACDFLSPSTFVGFIHTATGSLVCSLILSWGIPCMNTFFKSLSIWLLRGTGELVSSVGLLLKDHHEKPCLQIPRCMPKNEIENHMVYVSFRNFQPFLETTSVLKEPTWKHACQGKPTYQENSHGSQNNIIARSYRVSPHYDQW